MRIYSDQSKNITVSRSRSTVRGPDDQIWSMGVDTHIGADQNEVETDTVIRSLRSWHNNFA
jgi:hypothetical protein